MLLAGRVGVYGKATDVEAKVNIETIFWDSDIKQYLYSIKGTYAYPHM
jgi:hypothetical protein